MGNAVSKLAMSCAPAIFGMFLGLMILLAAVGAVTLMVLQEVYSQGKHIVIKDKP